MLVVAQGLGRRRGRAAAAADEPVGSTRWRPGSSASPSPPGSPAVSGPGGSPLWDLEAGRSVPRWLVAGWMVAVAAMGLVVEIVLSSAVRAERQRTPVVRGVA